MEELAFGTRLKHAWNAFTNRDPTMGFKDTGYSYGARPDRIRFARGTEKTIVTSVYNRIALDVAAINIKHCRMDSEGRYISDMKSGLNDCLSIEANIDQTGRALIQDAVMSMMDEGCVAIVPIDTDLNPNDTSSYDIISMRTAKIIEWKPTMVKLQVYNDRTGLKEEVWVLKRNVAIIENPLYAVVNEPNSTMQRLIRKLRLLDVVDEQSGAGKLDLIISLPYAVKTDVRREEAKKRLRDIEDQLKGPYGIAYTDGTEKITQLNRPIENNLMKQVETLTTMLYSQLGITQEILNGTADEKTMLNYYNRSIEPIVSAIVDEMKRKFLTKTARTQNQTIAAFRDPFKLVPVNDIAEIADKFTRNEIMTSNEIRQVIGMKPSQDPKADQLVNSNISQPMDQNGMMQPGAEMMDDGSMTEEEYEQAMTELDEYDTQLDEMENSLGHSDDLMHYSSPYYDPVKAHEYYMKNRELKGRTGVVKLNEEGRMIAKQVKENMTNEKNQRIEAHKKETDSSIEAMRNQKVSNVAGARNEKKTAVENIKAKREQDIQAHNEKMSSEISKVQDYLKSDAYKSLDEEAKIKKQEELAKNIEDLRADNEKQRAKIEDEFNASNEKAQTDMTEKVNGFNEEFKSGSSAARQAHSDMKTQLNDEYKQKYEDEENKLKSEERYRYKSQGRKKTKSSSSNGGNSKLAKYMVGGNTSVSAKKK